MIFAIGSRSTHPEPVARVRLHAFALAMATRVPSRCRLKSPWFRQIGLNEGAYREMITKYDRS